MPSTASHSVPARRVAAASLLALGFAVAAAAIALQPIRAAAGAPSATTAGPSASTSSIVTTQPLLQGSPAPGASQTTTTVARTQGPDRSNKTTRSTNYKVWGIVAALIAIAVIVGVLTWWYWQRTRPESSSPSPQDRWQREFRERAGAESPATDTPAASAATTVESAPPSSEASASGDAGPDTRDHTAEVPAAASDDHPETPERTEETKPAATEPEAGHERRPGGGDADERGSSDDGDESGPDENFADEHGPAGLADRVRRRSRFADIVITVPHPDDLRGEPS